MIVATNFFCGAVSTALCSTANSRVWQISKEEAGAPQFAHGKKSFYKQIRDTSISLKLSYMDGTWFRDFR